MGGCLLPTFAIIVHAGGESAEAEGAGSNPQAQSTDPHDSQGRRAHTAGRAGSMGCEGQVDLWGCMGRPPGRKSTSQVLKLLEDGSVSPLTWAKSWWREISPGHSSVWHKIASIDDANFTPVEGVSVEPISSRLIHAYDTTENAHVRRQRRLATDLVRLVTA